MRPHHHREAVCPEGTVCPYPETAVAGCICSDVFRRFVLQRFLCDRMVASRAETESPPFMLSFIDSQRLCRSFQNPTPSSSCQVMEAVSKRLTKSLHQSFEDWIDFSTDGAASCATDRQIGSQIGYFVRFGLLSVETWTFLDPANCDRL